MMLCESIRTFYTKDQCTQFQAVRWFGWGMSNSLSGLVQQVPKSHSLWDAAGGTIAENYGYYQETVVTPGDWLVVATDKLPLGSSLLQRYAIRDQELRDFAWDVPPGLVIPNHTKALEIAAAAGLLSAGATDTERAQELRKIEAYLVSGVWPCAEL